MRVAGVSGQQARNSGPMEVAARVGLTARGLVYLLLGALVASLAAGEKRSETDQRGALQELVQHTGGEILLVAVAIGFIAYALWQYAQAAFGAAGEGKKAGPRVKSLFRGIAYTSLAVSAFTVLAGRQQSQSKQSRELSARVMQHSGGRVLVFAVGAVIGVVGVVLVVEGVRRSFEEHLRLGDMSARVRKVVVVLGVVGTVARGAVFALVGVLVIDAAVSFDPQEAGGVDGAIRTIAAAPYGRVLLIVTAIGLLAFGAYALAEARWRDT